jgi:hypothetical protein
MVIVSEKTKALNEHLGEEVFPLQTVQSLTDRWKVSKHAVENWRARHADFPKPIEGFIEGSRARFYPLYEVIRYEQARGLK